MIGNFYRDGKLYTTEAIRVNDHDFESLSKGKVVPHGLYDVFNNIGFNVVFKWQDNNYYEGTFVSGTLPYFGWWDAQVTYRPPTTKSTFRIGGTNLGNQYQRTGFGSPAVGGLYYISYGNNLF